MRLAPDIVASISRRLAEHAGLELPAWVVEARATTRLAALGVAPEAYVELLASARGAGELGQLVEAVRVGESRLFRHRAHIGALANVLAPALRALGRRSVRVWSAGCAAGEEPYTLAIVLARALPDVALSILGTDVSSDALAAANAASYPRAELADVPAEYRDAFVVERARIRVRPELAQLVRFERANLVDAPPPRDCDLVWCRNVLIYFSAEARRRAIERLVAATRPGGFVLVGPSESLRDVPALEPRRAGDVTYYVRRAHDVRAGTPARTPGPIAAAPPARPTPPPGSQLLVVHGRPEPAELTREVGARLAIAGLTHLTLDLDRAELLGDELAPVLRRARAAARAEGITLVLRSTRPGTTRWLARHGLGDALEADA